MLNTEDFIKRLEFIMEHYGLSASAFADKIGVQRSSISHLLSGRNKPSLDFLMKIIALFPELNLYWLLDGSDTYLKNDIDLEMPQNMEPLPTPVLKIENEEIKKSVESAQNSKTTNQDLGSRAIVSLQKKEGRQLEKIVLFYTDGTFEDYKPSESK